MTSSLQERQREEVIGAYKAAVRLRLYSRISGVLGIVTAVAFFGAMIVGWLGPEPGVTGIVGSLLVTVGAAAKFYDQSFRTSISASGVERNLGLDEDLSAYASPLRAKLKTWSVIALAVGAVAVAAVLTFSIANAGTERDDDDDDDDRRTEQTDDDRSGGDSDDGDNDD